MCGGILLVVALFSQEVAAKPTTPAFTVPFTHVAQNEKLHVLLAEFARVQGYSVVVSPQLVGEVNGSFEQTNPYSFLDSMAAAYQVRWFLQGRNLTFYAAGELQQAFLAPSVMKAQALLGMLREAGLLSAQLKIRLMKNRNILYVHAPGFYIDQLRQAMQVMEQSLTKRIVVRVFPLQHAWAEDKTVASSNDTTVTVPGVASILRAMVTGQQQTASAVTAFPSAQQGLLGRGLNAKPEENATQAQQAQQAPRGAGGVNIIADPRVNAVIVHDAEYRMEYYARVIKDLDRPVRLVEIHAAIVDIDSNFKRELGINYQGSVDLGKGWSLGGSLGGQVDAGTIPSAGSSASSGLSFSTLYTRGTDYFLTRVKALEEDGVARMLGKPSVLTTDNVQATLENSSTYYVPISGYQATDLFKIETGTVLQVTPHIIPGKRLPDGTLLPDAIKLIVTVRDNQDDNNNSFSVQSSNPQPIKQTKINTQAIVSVGQSLLIAGYYHEKQTQESSGVPGLKNIPLLGRLFGSNKSEHVLMERLILITPRILNLEDQPPLPKRLDDPRFSRSATQADYYEREPSKPPVGGCTRKRYTYAHNPDIAAPTSTPTAPTVQVPSTPSATTVQAPSTPSATVIQAPSAPSATTVQAPSAPSATTPLKSRRTTVQSPTPPQGGGRK